MYADVQISGLWVLLCMPRMKLAMLREKRIMLHTVKSIHSRRALTFTACVDVTCTKLQSYKFHTGFLSAMLKNILGSFY